MDSTMMEKEKDFTLENADADSEIKRLLQMVEGLTQEVQRLSEKLESLERSSKQEKCILCPHISIRIPIHFPIHIPFANISKKP